MSSDPIMTISLVVTGAMNPRIHHPSWYRAIGAISKDAEQLALNDSELIVMEDGAQFKTAEYRIGCAPDRWVIGTSEKGVEEGFVQMVRIVFDEYLRETPVHAFGLNKIMHVPTPCKNVQEQLGIRLRNAALGLEDFNASSGTFEVTRVRDDGCRIKFQVQPSEQDAGSVFVHLNYHYQATKPAGDRYFQLGEQVNEHMSHDMEDAEALIAKLASNFGNPN